MPDTSGMTAQQLLDELMAGNDRYVGGDLTSFTEDLALIKQTLNRDTREPPHEPVAALLTCADARIPVEIIFDQIMGNLFVTRVAGNIATAEVIASIEYAVGVLASVKLIIVLGHRHCGAVKHTIATTAAPGQISALYAPIRPAVILSPSPDEEATTKANARLQAILLRDASPVIAPLVKEGKLLVVAAYYDIVTGVVTLVPLA